MAQARNDFKTAFEEIRDTALHANNPYELSEAETRNLTVSLNTLLNLIDHLDDDEVINGNFYEAANNDLAPIHLDNHPPGKKREEILSESLFGTFIFCFNNLKEMGNEPIKIFCRKMTGYCIEGRTRESFNYATSLIFDLDEAAVEAYESNPPVFVPVSRPIVRGFAQTLLKFFTQSIEGLGAMVLFDFHMDYPQLQTANSRDDFNSRYPLFNQNRYSSVNVSPNVDTLEDEEKATFKHN
jgi:hypothetical protein